MTKPKKEQSLPRVVSAEEWRVARDALAAERRRSPMVRIEKDSNRTRGGVATTNMKAIAHESPSPSR